MTDWKQFLTKQIFKESSFTNTVTISCDGRVWLPRTFDNRSDLMDLYQQVYKDGKWDVFSVGARWKHTMFSAEDTAEVSEWLFCLDGKGYEERCKHVAELYGWEGKNAS